MKRIGSGLAVAAACLLAGAVRAETAPAAVIGPGSYGQQLVAQLTAKHPEVRAMTLYITLPGGSGPEAIASSDGANGNPPPPAAAQALSAWRPHFAYDPAGRQLTAAVPMLDMSHKKAGVMTVVLTGKTRAALEREAVAIRDQLARRTSYAANLVQAAVDDPNIPVDSYAQYIVDDELAKHRDLMILAIHATTPKNSDPEILSSNIGRIGKKADDDDMRVVRDGKTNLEVNKGLMRYEVELPLNDSAGQRIGALGVVFELTAHTNQKARHAEAIRIRDEIARRIPTPARLVEPYTASGSAQPLALLHRSDLPGYDGDFDHLFADTGENKLFVAAEDHSTVEVFNLKTGEHLKTLTTFKTPHAFFLVPGTHRLIVTDNSGPRIIDDRTYQVLGKIDLAPGADTEYYDTSTGHLFIVSGGDDVNLKNCWLNEIDPATWKVLRQLEFDSDHVEAVQAEQQGERMFINVADKNEVDIVDKKTLKVTGRWPIIGAATNLAMALDERDHRLFVVTRKPTALFVLNTDNGHTVATLDVPAVNDGVYFDAARKRLYIPGAVGEVGVYQEIDPDHYREIARVPSVPGGKSELFAPQLNELFVAISPHYNTPPAGAVLWYKVEPATSQLASH
jgi:DNA-binding beta-propeller fold protein YncE